MLFLLSLFGCELEIKPDTGDTAVDRDGDGFAADDGDCDDDDASINPDGVEICDELDNDCDEQVDEDLDLSWYPDADVDGYGDMAATATQACAAPSGYVEDASDCDDADAAYHPGADEADCTDPNDYNCDGSVDYADADADGFSACRDCDDANAEVNSGAVEVCNGIDDDCDGSTDGTDAADPSTWYADSDSDGYGDATVATAACDVPVGYVSDDTDCNDLDPAFFPGADESDCADPNDYNCDGSVGYADGDGDGYAACEDCNDLDAAFNPGASEPDCADPTDYNCDGAVAYTNVDGDAYAACEDCDDTNAAVNADAVELCNAIDDDCDGTTDGADEVTYTTYYADADADGYGDSAVSVSACSLPSGYVSDATDCDDTAAATHPGASEPDCTDSTDYNCDGAVAYADADSDGFAACEDCNDSNAAVNASVVETCNGVDDNCDGTIDGPSEVAYTTYYADADSDGYGNVADDVYACARPSGYVADAMDCDDGDASTHPGASEPDCTDPNDYNCDGAVAYADVDADGFPACEECDDTDGDVNPDGTEACNGVDDDCDGSTDGSDAIDVSTWYEDADGDGYGNASVSTEACDAPADYVADDSDCDDTDPSMYAGSAGSQTLSYTGGSQTFTVPDCVTEVTLTAYGAQGQAAVSTYGYVPGYGGKAQGDLIVAPGEVLYIYVGGSGATGGYNGGGASWSGAVASYGGGASDVRYGGTGLGDRILVAGGGGGVSGETDWGDGGDGGGGTCGTNYCGGEGGEGYYVTSGGDGSSAGGSGVTSCHGGASGGGGITSGGGGATATCYGTAAGGTGTLGVGGTGAGSSTGCCSSYGVAGGGGGYYGGGGVAGGCCGGGGAGGGSSWTGTLTSPSFAAGVQTGSGQVLVSW